MITFAPIFEGIIMSNINDMTVGMPTKKILKFAIPLILGYILQQMYLIIDAAIVGRTIGVNALAAVGASSSIMFLIMGFCNGSCSGFSIPVAQSFGAKDYVAMRQYVGNALRLSGLIAIILTLITCLMCSPILRLVNTPADIFDDAYIFLLLNFIAISFTIAYNVLSGFIRSLGNSKQPFYFLIASSFLNIALDVLLIIVLHRGVEGAGLATCMSQAFAALLCYRYIKKKLPLLLPHGKEGCFDKKKSLTLLNNGIPMGLQFSITAIGIIMLQGANNALGTVYVAAFTASMRIKYLFTCVFENIGVAMATYCGQNIGAGLVDRVSLGIRSAIKIMLVYFILTVAIIVPFADMMMQIFVKSDETEIISNAALFMRTANYFYPALGILTILRYSIQGLGYSNLSMLSGVAEMIARCGVSIWLVPTFHFIGVCFGDPVAWVSADVFLIPAMIVLYHHLKRTTAKRYAI